MIRLKSPQDFWAGVLFMAVGAAALWFGRGYAVGTVTKMGPGFLPTALSWFLVGIGGFLALRALAVRGPSIDTSLIRPQLFILLAIAVFGLTIERFGLAPAVAAVAVLAALGSREMRWAETAALALTLAAASVVLFVYLLRQSMAAWSF